MGGRTSHRKELQNVAKKYQKNSFTPPPMNKEDGMALARSFKKKLIAKGIPIHVLYLFGSVAQGTMRRDSDIDIAVVCEPFRKTRHEENVEFLRTRRDVDLRIETVCLHPEDMDNRYSTIAQEVKRCGTIVE